MANPTKRAEKMVREQLRGHGIGDRRVLDAMARIPREEFVPAQARPYAYDDRALAIGEGQTISQPLVVAAMTEALAPAPGDRVLEVGGGSGYQAAVLASLCAHVTTLELEPALAERAAATLKRLGIENVEVIVADGTKGWPPRAPYDAILVAAATAGVPEALIEQLAEGGRLVLPLGDPDGEAQQLTAFRKRAGLLESRPLFPVRFVPLR